MTRIIAFALLMVCAVGATAQDDFEDAMSDFIISGDTTTADLDNMMERRVIRVLTTYNRTSFFIAGGRLRGFEYELLSEFEKFINEDVGRRDVKTTFVYAPVPKDELIPLLLAGRGDIAAAGLTETPERAALVDFSNPYLTGVQEVVVTHRDVLALESVDDLAGRTVHVVKGSSYVEHLKAISDRLYAFGKPSIDIVEVGRFLETEDLFEMANAGIIETMVADDHLALLWADVFPNLVVHREVTVNTGGKLGWMVRKNNPQLLAKVNEYVRKNRRGTLLGNVLFKRYYHGTKWITNPLSNSTQKRLAELRGLFEEYGEMYGIDWLGIAALSYQESQFNQSLRSHAGAVGVMQVKPETAKHMGIDDISDVRNNVHAGVKYLRWLMDNYYNDDAIPDDEKLNFVLASYNAGARRISRVRNRAEEMGYDRNLWFRNVERAAIRHVSNEPVKYVANINKYYLAFSMSLRNAELRDAEKAAAGGER